MVDHIRVGIITDGEPEIHTVTTDYGPCNLVSNLLIGEGFHWQKTCEGRLPGVLLPLAEPQGNIRMVNVVPIEDYILSVISSEMNQDAPFEFLKAHAVISRSWAVRKVLKCQETAFPLPEDGKLNFITWEESDLHDGFHVCNDDHCQRYQGFPLHINQNVKEAVRATRGLVLKDKKGEIADARFSKCCGGTTEIFSSCWADKDFDYLVSKRDPWCDLSTLSVENIKLFLSAALKDYDLDTHDFYEWTQDVDKDWLRSSVINKYGIDPGQIENLEVVKRGRSGRATLIGIKGSACTLTVGKELAIRRLLSEKCLYSSQFEVEDGGSFFRLTGRGWGHGVGLCQIGAARMAFEGMDYKSILQFYYPCTSIHQY